MTLKTKGSTEMTGESWLTFIYWKKVTERNCVGRSPRNHFRTGGGGSGSDCGREGSDHEGGKRSRTRGYALREGGYYARVRRKFGPVREKKEANYLRWGI